MALLLLPTKPSPPHRKAPLPHRLRRRDAEAAAGGGTPLETARQAEKGSLKSPYADFASVADEGHKKFMAAGCNGCHGGGGGGGMGPPLTNQVWVYGKDGDTLFRLIALGSDELQKDGYQRKGSENVVGPMPAMGGIVKSDDDYGRSSPGSGRSIRPRRKARRRRRPSSRQGLLIGACDPASNARCLTASRSSKATSPRSTSTPSSTPPIGACSAAAASMAPSIAPPAPSLERLAPRSAAARRARPRSRPASASRRAT